MGMARGRQAGSGIWRGAAVQVVCNAKVVGVIMIASLPLRIFMCNFESILSATIALCNCENDEMRLGNPPKLNNFIQAKNRAQFRQMDIVALKLPVNYFSSTMSICRNLPRFQGLPILRFQA